MTVSYSICSIDRGMTVSYSICSIDRGMTVSYSICSIDRGMTVSYSYLQYRLWNDGELQYLSKYGNAFVAFENSFCRTSVTTFSILDTSFPRYVLCKKKNCYIFKNQK